ncbi:MAG: helix-turn-helix domain-containing protein [Butyricicoccus sp.]
MNKITYNATELAEILGISVSGAYDLFHREDFPTLRIGRRLLVTKDNFEQWLATQSSPADKAC